MNQSKQPEQLGHCNRGNQHGHMLPHRIMVDCAGWRPVATPAAQLPAQVAEPQKPITADMIRDAWFQIGAGPGADVSGWYQKLADALNGMAPAAPEHSIEPPAAVTPTQMDAHGQIQTIEEQWARFYCKVHFSSNPDDVPTRWAKVPTADFDEFAEHMKHHLRTHTASLAKARELPYKWRLCAHLCVTEGLKDDRAKHRAIVYGECAEQLEAALRLTAPEGKLNE